MNIPVYRHDLALRPASDLMGLILSKVQVPPGAVDARVLEVRENLAMDRYDIEFEFRFPMGQLSLGL